MACWARSRSWRRRRILLPSKAFRDAMGSSNLYRFTNKAGLAAKNLTSLLVILWDYRCISQVQCKNIPTSNATRKDMGMTDDMMNPTHKRWQGRSEEHTSELQSRLH